MKKEQNFGCKVHHRVFFSKQEVEAHIENQCHLENIVALEGEDILGRMSYNIISESIDASNMSEEEKEGTREAYFW